MLVVGLAAPVLRHERLPRDPMRISMLLAAGLACGASMVDIAMNVPIVMALAIALMGRSTAVPQHLRSEHGEGPLP
jgi:hypothetical protein